MLTREGCLARRQRLWDSLPADVDWLLIADPRHVHYLSNFWVEPLSFSAGERGLLLLDRSDGATLFADNFALRSSAGEPHVEREVVEDWYDHRHAVINRDHALLIAAGSIAGRLSGRRGLIESEWLPLAAAQVLGLEAGSGIVRLHASNDPDDPGPLDLGDILRQLRRQKDPDEIELLRICMRATDAGHARAREVARSGVSELELYREVHSAALAAAGRPALVYGDFRAVNARSPKAGGLPTEYRLRSGDLFILDYSVVLDGYRSDFTNTISIGAPTDEQQMLFELCRAAMKAGEATLAAGRKASDVYEAVSGTLKQAGYGSLGHHAGHGIGLAHPEPPILVPESDDTLLSGDVVTLEPGLYVEGIGGMRIENNYLIHERGAEQLSQHLISLT